MKNLLCCAACFAIIGLTNYTSAQIIPSEADGKLDWWGDIEGFINQQDNISLGLVQEALETHPPSLEEPLERRMALLMIDGVLHEERAAHRPAVQQFFRLRVEEAIQEIENTEVTEGAMIWKLYNHGFIIRTATVTFGFDLVRAHSAKAEGFVIEDALMKRIVDQCDALFMSHRHSDHADKWVAKSFIDQGKPVVAPPEVWQDDPIHSKITHLKREAHTAQSLPIQGGKQELIVINYAGHQGDAIENNVPLVFSPEGLSFVQTGDQSNREDFSWIDEVGNHHDVDVLMPNCWTPDILRMVKGIQPQLVITGHENEMGHTIDHRESYWLTYTRLEGATAPYIVMTWGEAYHYLPNVFSK